MIIHPLRNTASMEGEGGYLVFILYCIVLVDKCDKIVATEERNAAYGSKISFP